MCSIKHLTIDFSVLADNSLDGILVIYRSVAAIYFQLFTAVRHHSSLEQTSRCMQTELVLLFISYFKYLIYLYFPLPTLLALCFQILFCCFQILCLYLFSGYLINLPLADFSLHICLTGKLGQKQCILSL